MGGEGEVDKRVPGMHRAVTSFLQYRVSLMAAGMILLTLVVFGHLATGKVDVGGYSKSLSSGILSLGDREEDDTGLLYASALQAELNREGDLWTFDSGVKLRRKYLLPEQISRFQAGRNIWEEDDEVDITRELKALKEARIENAVVMDIGAAYGYYSILSKLVVPNVEVHAINPNLKFFKQMKFNLAVNGLLNEVNVHQLAFGDVEGPVYIQYGVGETVKTEGKKEPNTMQTTFDSFSTKHLRGKLIWLVKMDVETFETRVLNTSERLLGHVKHWNIGTHGSRNHIACESILRSAGYTIIRSKEDAPGNPNGGIFASFPRNVKPLP